MAYSAAGNAVLPALVSSYSSTSTDTSNKKNKTNSSSRSCAGGSKAEGNEGCTGNDKNNRRRLLSLFSVQRGTEQQAGNRGWLPVGGLGSDGGNSHTAGVPAGSKYVQGQGQHHDGQQFPGTTNRVHTKESSTDSIRLAGTALSSALAGLSGGLGASSHMQSAAGGTLQPLDDEFYHHQDLAAIEGASSYHRALLQASATNALNPNAPAWDWVGLVVLGVFFTVIGLYLASHAYKKHKLAR